MISFPSFFRLHDRHLIFTIPPRLFIFLLRERRVAASRQLIWDHGWIHYSNGSGEKVSRKASFLLPFPIVVVVVDLIKDVTELKTFIEKLTMAASRCLLIMKWTLYTPQKMGCIRAINKHSICITFLFLFYTDFTVIKLAIFEQGEKIIHINNIHTYTWRKKIKFQYLFKKVL